MTRRNRRIRRRAWSAGGLFALSAACRFLLDGYSFAAFAFLCAGAAVSVYWFALRFRDRWPGLCGFLWYAMTVWLGLLLTAFVITELLLLSDAKGDDNPRADYVIVLGAGVNGTAPSRSLTDRLQAALAYLEKYPDAVAVLSGGQGNGEEITEARCMADWLTARGVSPARLLLEERATDTVENFRFSLELIRQRGGGSVAVVTSEYHVHRARCIARDLGVDARGVAANTSILPLKINYFCREAVGMWKYWIIYKLLGR